MHYDCQRISMDTWVRGRWIGEAEVLVCEWYDALNEQYAYQIAALSMKLGSN